jgi:tetratricopeptide (TPR) repeat protein
MVELINKAVKAKTNGDFEQVILLIDSVLVIDSNHYGSYVIKSGALMRMNRFTQSAEAFKKAVSVGKPDIDSYVRLGMLYEKGNMISEARAEYSRAIKLYTDIIRRRKPKIWQSIEYVVALSLNGNMKKFDTELQSLLKKFPLENNLKELKHKTRDQILDIRLKKYSG